MRIKALTSSQQRSVFMTVQAGASVRHWGHLRGLMVWPDVLLYVEEGDWEKAISKEEP